MSTWPNTVSLGGILLDIPGSRMTTKVTGLDDSAPIRLTLDEKSQQDGLWDATPYYSGRVIQIEGLVEEATSTAAHAVAASLRALGRQLNDFSASSAGRGALSAQVRIQTGLAVEWLDDAAFTYTITCVAPDPLLYGPEVFAQTSLSASAGSGSSSPGYGGVGYGSGPYGDPSSGISGRTWPRVWPTDYGVPPGVTPGAVTVPNAGTASYYPRLRIDGPVTNPTLTLVETGDTVRFNGSLATGQHLDINWGVPRRVTIGDNPVSMRHKISYSGNFLAVPVGGGSIAYSADTADPAAVLSVWSREGAWE